MRERYHSTKFIVLILFFALLACFFNLKTVLPPLKVSSQARRLNFSENSLYIHVGLKRMISSFLWIKTLLDADTEHYAKDDLNNWLFLRFKTITDLDPKFLEAYRVGGLYLSVIKDDVEGGSYLFEKGAKIYPDDYFLNYYASLHFFGEVQDYDKALKYMLRIKNDPRAPEILVAYISKIMEENEVSNKDILEYLENSIDSVSNQFLKKHLEEKIEQKKRALKKAL
ncbi:MAG: hypothetical protein H6621_06030 [Halobacteriovoraceae bacterium]|nr:hypothetical protein [Halobacteriovoraceae bacterium]